MNLAPFTVSYMKNSGESGFVENILLLSLVVFICFIDTHSFKGVPFAELEIKSVEWCYYCVVFPVLNIYWVLKQIKLYYL